MEKRKDILSSGGGREKGTAELSENEKLFDQIADFLFEGLKEFILDGKEVEFKDWLRRQIVQTLRAYKKDKKMTVLDALKSMFEDKERGLQLFQLAIRANMLKKESEKLLSRIEELIKRDEEILQQIKMGDIFNNLTSHEGKTDTEDIQ